MAECVLRHKAEQINSVAEPVLGALGGRKQKRPGKGRGPASSDGAAGGGAQGRDEALLRAISAAGLSLGSE